MTCYMWWDNNSSLSHVYQYQITLPTGADIVNSRQTIGTFNGYLGAIQLAPNNILYIAKLNAGFLAAVQNPNVIGFGANFVPNAFDLQGGTSKLGLPTFIQSYFINTLIEYDTTCTGEITQFDLQTASADSVRWNFGDPASGNANSSTTEDPDHLYPGPGVYNAYVILFRGCGIDTVFEDVEIFGPSNFNLGQDTFICDAGNITLFTGSPGIHTWSDGSMAIP